MHRPPPPIPPIPPPVPPAVEGTFRSQEVSAAAAELPVVTTRPERRRRGSASSGLALAVILILVAAATGIGGYVVWPRLAARPLPTVAGSHQSAPAGHQSAATTPQPRRPAPAPSPAISKPAGDAVDDPVARQRGREEHDRREARRRVAAEEERARADEARAKADREQATAEQERAEAEADRMQAEQANREKVRSQADGGVDRGLAEAYAALRRGDQPAVERSVAAAEQAAGDQADLTARVARWRLLTDYSRQLAGYREQAFTAANEGREYSIGERTIAIIEIGPERFSYKEAGRITRGSRASLPTVIQRAILRAWFEGDPRAANHIFLGVDRLLDDAPDLAKVRQEWETALEGEPVTASIMPLLDDPVIIGGR